MELRFSQGENTLSLAGRERRRYSISFMVICLAVLWRVYALTSYFCCSVREEIAMYLNFCFGLPKWRFMLRRAQKKSPQITINGTVWNYQCLGIMGLSTILWKYGCFERIGAAIIYRSDWSSAHKYVRIGVLDFTQGNHHRLTQTDSIQTICFFFIPLSLTSQIPCWGDTTGKQCRNITITSWAF